MIGYKEGETRLTAGGETARIYATDAVGDYPVRGAVFDGEHQEWQVCSWTASGYCVSEVCENPRDLPMAEPDVVISDEMRQAFMAPADMTDGLKALVRQWLIEDEDICRGVRK